jgi:response regulator RpfG family c-di-GMP phosphodiesterase
MLKIPTSNIHVLYIDHERHNLNSFTAMFRRSFNVFTASSLKGAETICIDNQIHVVIIDQYILTKSHTKLLFFAIKYIHQTRILLTGFADMDYLEIAVQNGQIFRYYQKPWNEIKLRHAIEEGYLLYNQRRPKTGKQKP